jgi:hypothetical protein
LSSSGTSLWVKLIEGPCRPLITIDHKFHSLVLWATRKAFGLHFKQELAFFLGTFPRRRSLVDSRRSHISSDSRIPMQICTQSCIRLRNGYPAYPWAACCLLLSGTRRSMHVNNIATIDTCVIPTHLPPPSERRHTYKLRRNIF